MTDINQHLFTAKPSNNYYMLFKIKTKSNKLIKNPFNSIHAIALGNLGELTSGLLMTEYLYNINGKMDITDFVKEYFKIHGYDFKSQDEEEDDDWDDEW